jgi:glycerone phosphate O-acyltransferase/fatty acyl-CoA reductase
MLGLGHYRNKLVHLFFHDGLWACALYAIADQTAHSSAPRAQLAEAVRFLYALLHREFVMTRDPDEAQDLEGALRKMIQRGILKETDNHRIEVTRNGESHFSFLCALLWPFIDSYFVATMILFSLQPDRTIEETPLIQRTQALATTMYHESMLCFYESCSKETLQNAMDLLESWQVIRVKREKKADASGDVKTIKLISLAPPFQEEEALSVLLERIGNLRKPPPVRSKSGARGSLHRNLIADLPILAKL